MQQTLDFLRGYVSDDADRYLYDMHNYTKEQWEDIHSFIQWMFPLPCVSKFHLYAPILTRYDVEIGREDKTIIKNLIKSTKFFLRFLGFKLTRKGLFNRKWRIERIKDGYWNGWKDFDKRWNKTNHNYLRITRMLQCLVLFGLDDLAVEIWRELIFIKATCPSCISDETMAYWRNALSGYSY